MKDANKLIPQSWPSAKPDLDPNTPAMTKNGGKSGHAVKDGSGSGANQTLAATSPDRANCLMQAIEAEIIPRLVASRQSCRLDADTIRIAQVVGIVEDDVHAFTDIVLGPESASYRSFVQAIRDRGVPVESIYLHLLSPAARSLGALWTSDACDFTQITIALWRMQQVMYDLSPSFHAGAMNARATNKAVMLTPVPGSQHTFGIQMVAEFFRRSNWDVWCEPACSRERLLKQVHSQYFDVAGISVGSEAQLPDLEQLIGELRDTSRNKSIAVLVGGPVLAHQPSLAQAIDADGTAADAESAVEKAETFIALGLPRPNESRVSRVS